MTVYILRDHSQIVNVYFEADRAMKDNPADDWTWVESLASWESREKHFMLETWSVIG